MTKLEELSAIRALKANTKLAQAARIAHSRGLNPRVAEIKSAADAAWAEEVAAVAAAWGRTND
tara:strand:- start:302 stop:490 length:189 start_codon:yes stop_codon:yes gene_type:complete